VSVPDRFVLSSGTPLGSLLGGLPHINPAIGEYPEATHFLSVVVRTRGTRPTLADTLTCLAAQTIADFEVLLFVDTESDSVADGVTAVVGRYDEAFTRSVHIRRVRASNRSAPLNEAIDIARGRWFAVLDDDDLVTANWVENFHDGAIEPDAIVRCRGVEQHVHRTNSTVSDLEPTTGFQLPYDAEFDLIRHMILNQSPVHTLAFPTSAIRRLGIRFDLSLLAHEDIDVVLRAAQLCGVHDTAAVTAIYRRWDDVEASAHSLPPEVWASTKALVLARLDAHPLLLPPHTATRLATLLADVERLRDVERKLEEIERSRAWRVTAPLRSVWRSGPMRRWYSRLRSLVRRARR
jgi:hypothetical protein